MRIIADGGSVLRRAYLHSDHLGSASLTTCGNSSGCGSVPLGGVVARQLYDAWGNVRYGGGMPTPSTSLRGQADIGYTGQRLDAATGGLMFYGARYYSPAIGRFISADTVVPGAGNPQQFNRYSYVSNNPVKKIDPSGHRECYGYAPSEPGSYGNGFGFENCTGGEWEKVRNEEALGKLQDQVKAECAGDPRCQMDLIRDAIDLGDKLLYAILPSTIGFEGYGSVGADMFVGYDASAGVQVIWNWRSGQFAIIRTTAANAKIGTPNLVSRSVRGGVVLSWGSSRIESYLGATAFSGGDLSADAVAKVGAYLQSSTSVDQKTGLPLIDLQTGMQVQTLAVGGQFGSNTLPNGIDGSLTVGGEYSYPIVICTPTGFLAYSCH